MNPAERKVAVLAGTHLAQAAAQNPLLRLTVRYWPIALMVGTALGVRLWKRHQDNELSLYNAITDTASIVTPWGSLALLSEFANRQERRKAQVPENPVYGPREAAAAQALPASVPV